MVKQANGSFELTVPLPSATGKILYKYVVDGEWKLSSDDRIEKDESGIENNVLEEHDLKTASKGSAIPEAGGLAYTPAATGEAKATVMPTSEPHHASVAGEPGIHIPKDPEALAAFGTVRDVDAKALNEPELTAEERKKQKKKVKRSQYKAKKKKRAAGAANGEGTTEGTSDFNSSPEPDAATKAVEDETAKDKKTEEILSAAAIGGVTAAASAPLAAQVPIDDISTKKAYVEDPEAETANPVSKSADAAIDSTASTGAAVTDVSDTPAVSKAEETQPIVADSTEHEPEHKSAHAGAAVVDVPETPVASKAEETQPVIADSTEAEPEHKSHTGAALGAGALGAGAGVAGTSAALGSSSAHKTTEAASEAVPVTKEAPDSKEAAAQVDAPIESSEPHVEHNPDMTGSNVLSPVSPPREIHTLDPKAHSHESASSEADKELVASPVDNTELPAATTATAGATTGATAGTSADTSAVAPTEAKDVEEGDEIVIAQGNGNNTKKEIEAAFAGQNGDVTLEEIKPTDSEAQRLKEEAHISDTTSSKSKSKSATTAAATSTAAPAAKKTAAKPAKEEKKKKKGGFLAKLKKIFD